MQDYNYEITGSSLDTLCGLSAEDLEMPDIIILMLSQNTSFTETVFHPKIMDVLRTLSSTSDESSLLSTYGAHSDQSVFLKDSGSKTMVLLGGALTTNHPGHTARYCSLTSYMDSSSRRRALLQDSSMIASSAMDMTSEAGKEPHPGMTPSLHVA